MTRRMFGCSLLLSSSQLTHAEESVIGNGSGLDHVGILTRDLSDLQQCYGDRLGFSLYRGSRYPTGIHNAIVPFEETPAYLELLSFYRAADRSDAVTAYLADRLRGGEGPAFFAVNCAPIEKTAAALREHGFP